MKFKEFHIKLVDAVFIFVLVSEYEVCSFCSFVTSNFVVWSDILVDMTDMYCTCMRQNEDIVWMGIP